MSDLTRDELFTIADRLDRAFQRRPLLPLQSLQYRLGETGQNRVHPYALTRALRALARPIRTKSTAPQPLQPWILMPQLYASASLAADEAHLLAEQHRPDLERLATADWSGSSERFIAALAQSIGSPDALQVPGVDGVEAPLAAELRVPGYSQVFRYEGAGRSAVHLWITQEARWIHPDDPRLWAFLGSCLIYDARPLVIARIIDPAAFPLFKALQVQGLQYYGMWSTAAVRESVAEIPGRLGWFYLNSVEEVLEHRLFQQLPRALTTLGSITWSEEARTALKRSVELGMGEAMPGDTERLLAWVQESTLALPDPWQDRLKRWIAWSQGSTLKLPKQSRRTTPHGKREATGTESTRPQRKVQGKTNGAADPEDEMPRGFGRKTTVSRVPIRLR